MAKILFLVRKLEGGGAERQLIVLSRELTRLGHDVTIAVWVAGGPYAQDVQNSGVRHVVVDKYGEGDLLGVLRRMRRMVCALRPDVIHGYLDTGNLMSALLRQSAWKHRVVWSVRGCGIACRNYGLSARTLWQVNRVASGLADAIISNSQAGAAHVVAQGYPADRVRVIPNGIDLDQFRSVPGRGSALRASWGVKAGERVVGLAARLDPVKDHETFAAAARCLSARRPEVRFVWAGAGVEPYQSAALGAMAAAGVGDRFRWNGFVQDMPAFYSALDVATSSSRSEGFSNTVSEAMACGVPCAVTDAGDSRLIVGQTGVVVPCRDPAALADAWETLLDRTGPQLSGACRARIAESFSVSRLGASTEDVILPPGIPRLAAR